MCPAEAQAQGRRGEVPPSPTRRCLPGAPSQSTLDGSAGKNESTADCSAPQRDSSKWTLSLCGSAPWILGKLPEYLIAKTGNERKPASGEALLMTEVSLWRQVTGGADAGRPSVSHLPVLFSMEEKRTS